MSTTGGSTLYVMKPNMRQFRDAVKQMRLEMQLFFFYGSLREGYWNQFVLSNGAKKLGVGETVKPFELYIGSGRVPCICPGGATPVKGDVYEVGNQDSKRIYQLENGYKHKEEEIKLSDGTTVKATLFYSDKPEDNPYMRAGASLILNGDYTTVIGKNGQKL
jgi:gamma-glutamylcyclotransferase (GGCT)/AIG2-like uncharacterized protein YtfP